MSDIRMQSIFLEEEFVFEHNADVKDSHTNRIRNERESHKHDGSSKSAEDRRKREERIPGGYNGRRSDAKFSKQYDTFAKTRPSSTEPGSKAEQKEHNDARSYKRQYQSDFKNRKSAKNESALMDMIDII